jgi:hypothetical protein
MDKAAYDKMKADLLARTKESYDRKDGEGGSRHFDTEYDIPFWKPQPTTGKPHILDILPFSAGPNFPTKVSKPVKEGDWVYVLDLVVHKNVGPGKMSVVCPAKNYGNRCPVCEEVESLGQSGIEYGDIPIRGVHQCTYNVLVMDDPTTEAKGVQVWDVSHFFSEKKIVALAISARDGGYIPFASPDHEMGRSLAFDVGKDKYRSITGHRFEKRDYDIPPEILSECYPLDTMIKIWSYDELYKILWGEEGRPAQSTAGEEQQQEAQPARRSLLRPVGASEPAPTATRTLRTIVVQEKIDTCPIGGTWADDHDKYEECKACDKFKPCAEALDLKELAASQSASKQEVVNPTGMAPAQQTIEPAPAAPSGARRLLLRKKV